MDTANVNISFNAYDITCQLKRKQDGKSIANFVHKIVKKCRTQFSPTNSLFSIYLYLTSIIKYVIYLPLPNSINFLWVRNRGDESCWVRISLVTNQFGYEVSSLRWEIVHKIVKKWRTQFFLRNSLFSTYLYLTSIIKYVIYWPLPNSINFLWVRNRGDESCWVRISLVTNQFGYEVSSLRWCNAVQMRVKVKTEHFTWVTLFCPPVPSSVGT